jgi:hypothetical protein
VSRASLLILPLDKIIEKDKQNASDGDESYLIALLLTKCLRTFRAYN